MKTTILLLAITLMACGHESIIKITHSDGNIQYVECNRGYDLDYDKIHVYYDTDSTSRAEVIWIDSNTKIEQFNKTIWK